MAKINNELISTYYELGDLMTKFISYQSIIQIDVKTTLEAADTIEDGDRKSRFLEKRYYELVDMLQKAGIIE